MSYIAYTFRQFLPPTNWVVWSFCRSACSVDILAHNALVWLPTRAIQTCRRWHRKTVADGSAILFGNGYGLSCCFGVLGILRWLCDEGCWVVCRAVRRLTESRELFTVCLSGQDWQADIYLLLESWSLSGSAWSKMLLWVDWEDSNISTCGFVLEATTLRLSFEGWRR